MHKELAFVHLKLSKINVEIGISKKKKKWKKLEKKVNSKLVSDF